MSILLLKYKMRYIQKLLLHHVSPLILFIFL